MILEACLKISTQTVSSDYRRSFIHSIKEAFKNTEYRGIVLSEERAFKPYTFSVVFKSVKNITSEQIDFSGELAFRFSSIIFPMTGYLYNYMKSQNFVTIFGSEILEKRFKLVQNKRISSRKVEFKILGAAVFTKKNGGMINLPDDLEESMNYSLQAKMEYLRKLSENVPAFSPIKVLGKAVKYTRVRHYGGMLDAFRGHLLLEGDPKVLEFAAQVGIGVRTGQGFGMVKVVREWS